MANLKLLSVSNWWHTKLLSKELLGKSLDDSQTFSKLSLYNDYKQHTKESELLGTLLFWQYFSKMLTFSETSTEVTLPPLNQLSEPELDRRSLFMNEDSKSVRNWWNVCLSNGRLTYNEYKWNNVQLKKLLYDSYREVCVGEPKGTLMFWKYLQQLVSFKLKDYKTVQLPSLEESRRQTMDWKCEYNHAFLPKSVLSH